jgi:uncharacterized repeat protein (TIGR03803 family)
MLPPMISGKMEHLVAFGFALGLLVAAIPCDAAAASNSTTYSFGTTEGDGAVPKGGHFQLLHKFGETHHDGKNPYGSLLLVGDKLYGTTANGGDNDMGTVFVINTDGNNYQRLYSFGGQTNNWDGAKPIDNVILVNGWLYGMTTAGDLCQGTIFKVSPTPGGSPTPVPRPTPPH